jgi:hypothetical protein
MSGVYDIGDILTDCYNIEPIHSIWLKHEIALVKVPKKYSFLSSGIHRYTFFGFFI